MSSQTRLHLLLLTVSAIYLCSALALSPPTVNGSLSPSFFPIIVGTMANIFCLLQLLRDYHKLQQSMTDLQLDSSTKIRIRHLATNPTLTLLLITGVYIALFVPLGSLISSVLYTYAVMLVFSDRNLYLQKAIISVVITAIGYFVFQELFNVRLPTLWE